MLRCTPTGAIAAADFFVGIYTTALAEDEIITSMAFRVPDRAAWQKFRQTASRFSLVGVFVSQGPAGVRVAVTGAGASVDAQTLNSDLHGSAEYRAALIPVLAARAVGTVQAG